MAGPSWPPQEWTNQPPGAMSPFSDAPGGDVPPALTMEPPPPPEMQAPPMPDVGTPVAGMDWVPQAWRDEMSAQMPRSFQGQPVEEVDTGMGLQMQHQPQMPEPPTRKGKAAKAPQAQAPTPMPEASPVNQEKSAIQQQADAESERANFMALKGYAVASDAQAQIDAAERIRQEGQKAAVERVGELNKEANDLAKTKVGLADRTIGQKVVHGAAAFLSGMLAARQGKAGNPYLEMVERMMEQEYDRQRTNIQTRQGALGEKRGLLAMDIANGREDYESRYKTAMAGYQMAKEAIMAEASKYESPVIQARAQQAIAQVDARQAEAESKMKQQVFENGLARSQAGLGWAKLGEERRQFNKQVELQEKAGPKRDIQAEKFDGSTVILSHKQTNKVIGRAPDEKAAENARKIIENNGRITALYERGKELFKNGRADNPGSDLYRQQQAFDVQWVNATKTADGDFSAPNNVDFEKRGIHGGITSMNPVAALDESFLNARAQGKAALRPYMDEDTLNAEGFGAPPKDDGKGAKGNRQGSTVVPILYKDDDGTVNDQGRGSPMSPEESAAVIESRKKAARPNHADWQYKRSQNNIAARSGRKLPFPDAGTGSID